MDMDDMDDIYSQIFDNKSFFKEDNQSEKINFSFDEFNSVFLSDLIQDSDHDNEIKMKGNEIKNIFKKRKEEIKFKKEVSKKENKQQNENKLLHTVNKNFVFYQTISNSHFIKKDNTDFSFLQKKRQYSPVKLSKEEYLKEIELLNKYSQNNQHTILEYDINKERINLSKDDKKKIEDFIFKFMETFYYNLGYKDKEFIKKISKRLIPLLKSFIFRRLNNMDFVTKSVEDVLKEIDNKDIYQFIEDIIKIKGNKRKNEKLNTDKGLKQKIEINKRGKKKKKGPKFICYDADQIIATDPINLQIIESLYNSDSSNSPPSLIDNNNRTINNYPPLVGNSILSSDANSPNGYERSKYKVNCFGERVFTEINEDEYQSNQRDEEEEENINNMYNGNSEDDNRNNKSIFENQFQLNYEKSDSELSEISGFTPSEIELAKELKNKKVDNEQKEIPKGGLLYNIVHFFD